jgi:hypothetical protein
MIEKSNDLIGNRTRGLPACSIVPLPTSLRRVHIAYAYEHNSRVRIDTHLSYNFPIQNGLKHGDALSSLLLNFALEHAIRKAYQNQVEFKLNGTHRLLVYADDVNLLGDNIDTIKKNTQTLSDASKEVGLEVNTEKTKYMLLSYHQTAEQNHEDS